MKASPALLAATALVLTSFAYAQANSDKTPAPQARPAPTTHRGAVPGGAGNGGAPQPAPGMAIAEQGITNSKPKHKPHAKMENSGDPHENMNGREAGSGMATGRRTIDANASANAEIKARARYLWEQNGCPAVRDLEFWLQAEAKIKPRERHVRLSR